LIVFSSKYNTNNQATKFHRTFQFILNFLLFILNMIDHYSQYETIVWQVREGLHVWLLYSIIMTKINRSSQDLWSTDTSLIRRVRHVSVSVSNTDTTLMITLNYVIFPNYHRYRRVRVSVLHRSRSFPFILSIPSTFSYTILPHKPIQILFISFNKIYFKIQNRPQLRKIEPWSSLQLILIINYEEKKRNNKLDAIYIKFYENK
jgi:hypothetical protein